MTLVAKPQSSFAAVRAQDAVAAVMINRVPVIGNASANVSQTGVPCRFKIAGKTAVSVAAVNLVNPYGEVIWRSWQASLAGSSRGTNADEENSDEQQRWHDHRLT